MMIYTTLNNFYVLNKYTEMKSTWLLCFYAFIAAGGGVGVSGIVFYESDVLW